jgi:hypothetical protein
MRNPSQSLSKKIIKKKMVYNDPPLNAVCSSHCNHLTGKGLRRPHSLTFREKLVQRDWANQHRLNSLVPYVCLETADLGLLYLPGVLTCASQRALVPSPKIIYKMWRHVLWRGPEFSFFSQGSVTPND